MKIKDNINASFLGFLKNNSNKKNNIIIYNILIIKIKIFKIIWMKHFKN